MLIGGIEVGPYGELTCAALARALGLNGSLTEITHKAENIRGENDTISGTLAITEEEAEK